MTLCQIELKFSNDIIVGITAVSSDISRLKKIVLDYFVFIITKFI